MFVFLLALDNNNHIREGQCFSRLEAAVEEAAARVGYMGLMFMGLALMIKLGGLFNSPSGSVPAQGID